MLPADPDRIDEDFGVDPELGRIVLRCRSRRAKDRMLAQGYSPLGVYLQTIFAPVAFLYCGVMLLAFTGVPPGTLGRFLGTHPRGLLVYILIGCVLSFWYLLRLPRSYPLVLCEHGLRYKRQAFRFDEIARIRFGRDMRGIESAIHATNRAFGVIHPGNRAGAALMERVNQASLTIILRDGSVRSLKAVEIRCEPEGYRRLIESLMREHREFFEHKEDE